MKDHTRFSAVSINFGAACATSATIWAITSPVFSTRASNPPSLNASCSSCTIVCASLTTSFIGVSMFSYSEIPRPSSPDFKIVICPCRLSFIVSAISAAAPSQFAIDPDSDAKSSSDALTIASSPVIAS